MLFTFNNIVGCLLPVYIFQFLTRDCVYNIVSLYLPTLVCCEYTKENTIKYFYKAEYDFIFVN